jgi:hypothetical protein
LPPKVGGLIFPLTQSLTLFPLAHALHFPARTGLYTFPLAQAITLFPLTQTLARTHTSIGLSNHTGTGGLTCGQLELGDPTNKRVGQRLEF